LCVGPTLGENLRPHVQLFPCRSRFSPTSNVRVRPSVRSLPAFSNGGRVASPPPVSEPPVGIGRFPCFGPSPKGAAAKSAGKLNFPRPFGTVTSAEAYSIKHANCDFFFFGASSLGWPHAAHGVWAGGRGVRPLLKPRKMPEKRLSAKLACFRSASRCSVSLQRMPLGWGVTHSDRGSPSLSGFLGPRRPSIPGF